MAETEPRGPHISATFRDATNPMFRSLSALFTRPAALATSVALHVGAVVVGGHALSEETAQGGDAGTPPLEIDVQVEVTPTAPLAAPAPEEKAQPSNAPKRIPAAGHRHAYPVSPDHDAHPHDPSLVHLVRGAPPPVSPEVAPVAAPLHFVLSSEHLATRGATAPPPGSATTSHVSRPTGSGTFDVSAVDEPAHLLSSVPVVYPEAARVAGVEADVVLDLVVDGAGRVTSSHPLSAQGLGLADAAQRAVGAYRFTPARRAGHPVSVRMRWTVTFRLQ
jgi:TonB family protein